MFLCLFLFLEVDSGECGGVNSPHHIHQNQPPTSVFAQSSKAFTFLKFWRPLCHKVNLPSCVARRPLCHGVNLSRLKLSGAISSWLVVFSAPDILGLRYLFGKTYKQPTVPPLKSLTSTHSTKFLHLLRGTIRYHSLSPSPLYLKMLLILHALMIPRAGFKRCSP